MVADSFWLVESMLKIEIRQVYIIEFFNGSFYRGGYLKAMVDQVRNF